MAEFKFPDIYQCDEHQHKEAHGTSPTPKLHGGFSLSKHMAFYSDPEAQFVLAGISPLHIDDI